LDPQPIFESARRSGRLLTIEDHGPGGLGTIVAESLWQSPATIDFRKLTFGQEPIALAGRQDYLRNQHGMDESGIGSAIREWVGR